MLLTKKAHSITLTKKPLRWAMAIGATEVGDATAHAYLTPSFLKTYNDDLRRVFSHTATPLLYQLLVSNL